MNDLDATKLEVKRAFPELGGYHLSRYARVLQVKPASGVHDRLQAICKAAVQLLTPSLEIDRRFKELTNIPLMGMHRHIVDPPLAGDYVLLKFPHGLANTAILEGVLYDGRSIEFEPGSCLICGAKKIKFSAERIELGTADDQAVLHSKLVEVMGKINKWALALLDSQGSLVSEGTITWADTVEPLLEDMASSIKLGKDTQ